MPEVAMIPKRTTTTCVKRAIWCVIESREKTRKTKEYPGKVEQTKALNIFPIKVVSHKSTMWRRRAQGHLLRRPSEPQLRTLTALSARFDPFPILSHEL